MTYEQILAFGLIAVMMAAFLWEKFRYDVVACVALVAAVVLGLLPAADAFSGFSDDLVIIVGSALVVSAGVARSGVVDLAIKRFFPALTSLHGQMLLLLVTVTVLSAFIKNIGALAIMMPVAFQFARRSSVPPSVFLMPMAFSALLGGLMTQIGTSPNIAVSRLREELTGQPFTMFDFTPVGATLAAAGIVFLIFFYWLVPRRENQNPSLQEALEASSFATEAMITRQSSFVGKTLHHLLQTSHGEVTASAILRGQTRLSPFPDVLLHEEDTLLLEGPSEALDRIVSQGNLSLSGNTDGDRKRRGDISSVEAVIGRGSPLIGQTTSELSLVHTYGVNLLAVSRQGKRIRERLGQLTLRSGDVVVLQGLRQQMPSILTELGCLPLAEREILLGTSRNIFIPLAILVIAMGATALGLAPVAIAFFAASACHGRLRRHPRERGLPRRRRADPGHAGSPDPRRRYAAHVRWQRRHCRLAQCRSRRHAGLGCSGNDPADRHGRHALPQQCRDRSRHGPDRRKLRNRPRLQAGSLPDGRCHWCRLRFPHPHRPPVQHAGHGSRRLPLFGLSKAWASPLHPHRPGLGPGPADGLAGQLIRPGRGKCTQRKTCVGGRRFSLGAGTWGTSTGRTVKGLACHFVGHG